MFPPIRLEPRESALQWVLGMSGVPALINLSLGSGRALKGLEWRGGDRWRLWRADGRCAEARLDPRSRCLGRALLLVYRRGVFRRLDRPWVLLLPHMVSDVRAARHLRMRFTLDARVLLGSRQT